MAAIFGCTGGGAAGAGRLARMAAALAHRGKAPAQLFERGDCVLGLRLPAGGSARQAAYDSDAEQATAVLDGVILNAARLRAEFESRGQRLASGSDAELVLRLYREAGADGLRALRGPFAAALWDARVGTLVLVRDHVGHKPLFHAQSGGRLSFASEPKALLAAGVVPFAVDPQALSHFLSLRFVPAPHSLVRGIGKLAPAHALVRTSQGATTLQRYWAPSYARKHVLAGEEMVDGLEAKLRETIAAHLDEAVPTGAFLSAGLDSGLIVANMAQQLGRPFDTFSLGVHNASDEVPTARLVARKFGAIQHEAYPDEDIVRLLPAMIWHLDEPSDMVVVSKYLVARLAAPHVRAALSGDGGDELFAGFLRYLGLRDARYFGYLPAFLRDGVIAPAANVLGGRLGLGGLAGKLLWLTAVTRAGALPQRYAEAVEYLRFRAADKRRLFTDRLWAEVELSGVDSRQLLVDKVEASDAADPIEKLLHTDLLTRLPEHLLMLDDRTGAAHGLDVLCPLADRELVEYGTAVPADMKIRGREAKYIERRLAERVLPREVVEFRKTGWSFPFAALCAGPLQPFLRSVFGASRLVEDGLFRGAELERLVMEHGGRTADHHIRLWMLLSLEIWYRMQADGLHHEGMVDWLRAHLAVRRG